jgi:pyruvate formate lyase activating enzyme
MGKPASCQLCPHRCAVPEDSFGFCGVRQNRDGAIRHAAYGKVSAIALDPIEKKPLYMFHPGKMILSIGGYGCNFRCPFCQNCHISIEHRDTWRDAETVLPEQIVSLAERAVPDGNIGVAYTYNEPLIGVEFVYDCARLIRKTGLCNVLVTNGYINREPLEALLPYIDAMNIDLKGFREGFYEKLGGSLGPVKETIRLAHRYCHVEITTLIVPGENEDDIDRLAEWIASVGPEIPLHLTRFFPRYTYTEREPASTGTIDRLRGIAQKHLKNVFTRR